MKIEDIKDVIEYIEINEKGQIIAHTANDSIKVKYRGKFRDLLKCLPKNFKLCNFDCIVNDDLVTVYNFIDNCFTLKSGKTVNLLIKSFNLNRYYGIN